MRLLDAAGPRDELEEMFERGWSDGLPVIPPTRERVAAMLGGRDPIESLGEVPPAMGEATLERVAACAVLAGCRPEYFPVVVAAAQAALEPAFNLNGQAVTTQPAGQLVILNGPARETLGLNTSIGALGPGWRPNLTIGRALRLLVSLTGGGFPGRMDRATLGHPGKIGICLAESEEVSPWEPLHVERGFEADQSVVTVIACDAPISISDHRSPTPEELARVLGWAGGGDVEPELVAARGSLAVRDLPRARRAVRRARLEQAAVREEMFAAVRRPARELRWGETTPQVHAAEDDLQIRSGIARTTSCSSSREAKRAVTRRCSGRASACSQKPSQRRSHGIREPIRRAAARSRAARPARQGAAGRHRRAARYQQAPRRRVPRPDRGSPSGAGAQTFRVVKEIFSKPANPDIIRRIAGRGDLAVEALAD